MPQAQRYCDGRSGDAANLQKKCRLTHAWLHINAPAQSLPAMHHGTASAAPRTMLSFPDSRFPIPDSRFPIPDSRDASITTHPVTQITCNRLQAFREGMCTTFVAILSFSPAAATGTT
ncbi:hypothetical protein ACDJ03_04410 [Xanthomonas axonopodis pv. nakataecorchori]|uniref:hypothetical protein n=1 Tax=Xanthomonas axonopodis TaxID=53413 RepID=UPI0035312D02